MVIFEAESAATNPRRDELVAQHKAVQRRLSAGGPRLSRSRRSRRGNRPTPATPVGAVSATVTPLHSQDEVTAVAQQALATLFRRCNRQARPPAQARRT